MAIAPLRPLRILLGALSLAVGVRADNAPAGPAPTGLPAEVTAWLARQPPAWSTSVTAEAVAGFKDNLLLSAEAAERSGLIQGSVEALTMRRPGGRWEQSFFVQAEGTRFFSGRSVDHEATAWIQSDLGLRAGEAWKFSVPVTGYYYDQVFDVSDTEVERLVAEMRMSGLMAGPAVRWTMLPSTWLEVQGVGDRKRYDDEVNDSKTGELVLRLGWSPRKAWETRLTGARRWRDFDSRVLYSAAGRPLPSTRLRVAETEVDLRIGLKWGRDGSWQAALRAGALSYRDNGSGYFNHRERRLEPELEWSPENWLVRVGGAARRVDFDVRTVGLGINPPARLKDEYEFAARVERKLTPRWALVANFKWERTRSNDAIASYRVNEGLLGARWSWEK